MNTYQNTINKVKLLLKEDDQLTKEQCEMYQWQLLAKVPGTDYTFVVGKGGVNTMFYSASSAERATCYPEDMLEILNELAKSKTFVYVALDKRKEEVGFSAFIDKAKKMDGAKYIVAVSFSGKKKTVMKKQKDLFGKKQWEELG